MIMNEESAQHDADDQLQLPLIASHTSSETDEGTETPGSNVVEDTAEDDSPTEGLAARDHSYLPGTSHPLFPESLLDRRRRCRSNSFSRGATYGKNKRIRNLDTKHGDTSDAKNVPEMNDVSFDASQTEHGPEVSPCHKVMSRLLELPILELNGVVLFPGSTIPIRLRHRHWVEYLGRQIDVARGIRGIGSGSEEVRLGILTFVDPRPARVQQLHRQRRSWMRTAINPRRGSQMAMFWREYDRLFHESIELLESESGDSESPSDPTSGSPTGRQRANDPESQEVSSTRNRGRERRRQARQHQTDPWIGRIGTMATVTCTHEDAAGAVVDAHQTQEVQRSLVWQRSEDSQLVVTALGTGRFRIVSCIDSDDDDGPGRLRRTGFEGDMASVRLYRVEELLEQESPLPPRTLRRKLTSSESRHDVRPVPFLLHHEQIIQNMSRVSPVPHFVFHASWPWRLVGLIMTAIDRIPGLEGFRRVLPCLPGGSKPEGDIGTLADSLLEPLRFSFWMACNMPFSEDEKLELLEMHCTVKRLQFIYKKVLEQEQRATFVHCKSCLQKLSQTSNIFSVGGAEGTTGAYVNEHGIVHQTITLRKVDETSVFCSGGPETKDSWFPGYSWTITYCNVCHAHLGWKFLRVKLNGAYPRSRMLDKQTEGDRPDMFWGMSSASITTETVSIGGEE